jgi:Tudor domain
MYAVSAQVTFVDFGNKETVQGAAVRAISPELSALAPQAQMLQLANLKVTCCRDMQHPPEAGVRAGSIQLDGLPS